MNKCYFSPTRRKTSFTSLKKKTYDIVFYLLTPALHEILVNKNIAYQVITQTTSSKAIIIRKVQVRSVWDSLVKSVNKLCFEYRPHILNFFQGCRQVVFLFQSASTAAVIQDNFLKRAAERKIPRVGKKN